MNQLTMGVNMKIKYIAGIVLTVLLLGGCASQPDNSTNPYTQGNVTLHLKKDVTSMAEVDQAFGAPNIVTQDANGNQVWIYQKNNISIQSGGSSGYATILIAGIGGQSSHAEQSSRTMTLTIYFNKHDIVRDFKSMSTSF